MPATPQPYHRRRRRTRALLVAAAGIATVGAFAVALPASAGETSSYKPGGHKPTRYQDVQLLSFNDLHGNLEPPGSSGRVTELQPDGTTKTIDAGGVEYLATHLREARKENPYSITAAGGDMVGASPLISGLFHDEPTIEALNGLELDVTAVGNHEFDEGAKELARMQNGGCHPVDGCYVEGEKFSGADFPYLAANVLNDKTNKPILKPYWVWKKNGVKIGFIGVTLEDTPGVVSAEGVKGLKFKDEVETINKYAKELERQGVRSVVALIHEGGLPASTAYNYDCDAAGGGSGLSGPIVDIAKNITPKVDALVTGHTHAAYACTIPDPSGKPRTVTSAAAFGRLYTDTTLTYDRWTGDIARTAVSSANHVVTRTVAKAADMTALISRWNTLAAPIGNRAVGYISADIPSTGTESPMGDLIADAQLAYGKKLDPETDLALMNSGGVRGGLTFAAKGTEGDGVVTYAEGFTVQPFSNTVNLQNFTGAQLISVLQEQVSGSNTAAPKILQPSTGLTYTLDMTKTGADRIVVSSVLLNGAAIDPAATYRVATNSFLAGGGDGYPTLGLGTNDLVGGDDLAALADYLTANSTATTPIAPPAANRITIVK